MIVPTVARLTRQLNRLRTVAVFTRERQRRCEFTTGLRVERVVIAADKTCPCCGSDNLSKLGESAIRALETMPAQHKIIETVRECLSCRSCQTIT